MKINEKATKYMVVGTLVALWTIMNAFAFAECPNKACVSNLCPLAQYLCSQCPGTGQACLNCMHTDAQTNKWGSTEPNNGTQCTQTSTTLTCNKVYGCVNPPLRNYCQKNPKDVRQPQSAFVWSQSDCPGG